MREIFHGIRFDHGHSSQVSRRSELFRFRRPAIGEQVGCPDESRDFWIGGTAIEEPEDSNPARGLRPLATIPPPRSDRLDLRSGYLLYEPLMPDAPEIPKALIK